jgi:hypothetical protein
MSGTTAASQGPPPLRSLSDGSIDNSSLADLVEWFLNFDERTARMRHPHTDELFQWKQQDDEAQGIAIYPFENAEARFAIGVFQALAEYSDQRSLQDWITQVLEALGRSRDTRTELTTAYSLDADLEASAVKKAEKLTTATERRVFLSSCWLEVMCTAEARVLGWIYQDLYGVPFEPSILEEQE